MARIATRETLVGLRALVVEDELLIAEELRERLTRLGLEMVDVVDNGEAAIKAAERHRPELILMDIRLKGRMDGIEAAAAIGRTVAAPVIFVTAHADRDTLRRAKGSEPYGYVLKPFDERELVVAIEMAIHRHELERRLRASERRYAATLASIGDGVVATDAEGRVTFFNAIAEALTGLRPADAQGRPVEEVMTVVVEADHGPCEHPARRAMRLNTVVRGEAQLVLVTADRQLVPIDESAAPIAGDGDGMLGAVVAFRDIRQRRLAEDALRRAEDQLHHAQKMEAIGRLAGGIAHDFNNLLTVIAGATDILLDEGCLAGENLELVQEIRRSAERAGELTGQLLVFSRRQPAEPTDLDLGDLVRETEGMLRRLAGFDVELHLESPPDLWLLHASRGQVEQLLLNLVVNARDAMPAGGALVIETSNVEITPAAILGRPELRPGRYVLLEVRDTGVGMDAAVRERAFEPFFTTKASGKGTGLGLASVYGTVRQYGGFIDLYSEVGVGTTFHIYFPASGQGKAGT